MKPMGVSYRADIAEALLSYLVDNVGAGDTLEGIVQWWLLDRKISHDSAEVKRILDDFVARELILESKTSDKRIHYRVNRHKEEEIRELLKRRDV